jgi:peptidoglycan/LPS O-acetylase OafA/YrhL
LSQSIPHRRISGADGLRAIACLWVFFHHAGIEFDPRDRIWHTVLHDQGILGVAIFFVLSGLLLTIPFCQASIGQRPWPALTDYAKARLGRVVPAYYLCVMGCWAIFPNAPDRGLRTLSALTFTNWTHWRTFFPAPVNAALWSIGIEVCFYVLLPLWALGFRIARNRTAVLLFWGLTQLGIVGWQLGLRPRLGLLGEPIPSLDPLQEYAQHLVMEKNPLALFSHFLFGSAAAVYVVLWQRGETYAGNPSRRFNRFDVLAGLSLLVLAVVIHPALLPWAQLSEGVTRAQIWAMSYRWPLFPALVATLLVAMHRSLVLGRLFDNWLLSGVCKLSYGIYLWHMVVLKLFSQACPWTLETLPKQFAASLASLAITVMLAGISYRFVEVPAMNLLKRRQSLPGPRPQLA